MGGDDFGSVRSRIKRGARLAAHSPEKRNFLKDNFLFRCVSVDACNAVSSNGFLCGVPFLSDIQFPLFAYLNGLFCPSFSPLHGLLISHPVIGSS